MNSTTFFRAVSISPHLSLRAKVGRYVIILLLLAIPVLGGSATREVFLASLSDAYIAVTVFVALTLLLFYAAERFFRLDTGALLEKYRNYQIPIAALLGALPGCGGAIMVVTQYSIGRAGFGAMVAVLTSTMGDAAFLLIAKEPQTGLMIMALSMVVGTVFGYLVEFVHGRDFMAKGAEDIPTKAVPRFDFGRLNWPWIALLVPGIVFAFMSAFQIDIDAVFGIPDLTLALGAIGAVMSIGLWFINPTTLASFVNRTDEGAIGQVWDKTTTDTCFVTVWVVIAFLLFELSVLWMDWDLKAVFSAAGPIVPLIAVVVGFLPGCGPQILTTTFYLQGIIPLSAQIGNAISNDGDALFPALAVAPKASIVATFYTAIPALVLAYGYYFFFEL